MSSSSPTILLAGEQIPLRLKLEDGATDKYVLCYVSTDTGVNLTGSPFSVPHVERGIYYLKTPLTFPDGIDEVRADFIVYDDAAYTIESEDHSQAFDLYQEDIRDSLLAGEIEELQDLITSLISQVAAISPSAEIDGFVDDSDDLVGMIEDEGIIGTVDSDEIVGTFIDDEDLTGFVDDTDGLEGSLLEEI